MDAALFCVCWSLVAFKTLFVGKREPGSIEASLGCLGIERDLRGWVKAHSLCPDLGLDFVPLTTLPMITCKQPRILRVLLTMVLWIGVSVSAAWSPPADVRPASATAATTDPWVALIDYLGGSRICGDDEVEEVDVLCGGDLLIGRLMIDPQLLVMQNGTCSRLLEQLFGDQTCDPMREDCDGIHHSGVPPSRTVSAPVSSSVVLATTLTASWRLGGYRLAVAAGREQMPASQVIAPISPPPRALATVV